MASDELMIRQRDALVAQTKSSARRSDTQSSGSPDDIRESQRGSRATAALVLQSQLAQISRSDKAALAEVLGEQYLVFSLLEREFAFKAEYIQGVERLVDVTPIPNIAPWIRGVINLRGSIASVVDLRSFLDMEQLPYNPRTRLLSVQYNEMVICLVVDGVSEMLPIPPSAITSSNVSQNANLTWGFPYTSGVAVLENRVIVLVDAARLLFSDKMQRYEALQ